MSINPDYFNIIKTSIDNNCLFCSFVIFLNKQLLNARRNKDGKPCNKNYLDFETNCTKFLRETVVRMINYRKHKYSKEEYFDAKQYTSIDERIEKMSQDGEFGGKLEMDIISKMYKVTITVLIKFNDEYSSIYTTANDVDCENESVIDFKDVIEQSDDEYCYSDSNNCFLLLDENHYNLLEPNYVKIKKDFPPNKLEQVIIEDKLQSSVSSRNNSLNCSLNNSIISETNNEDRFDENVKISISDKYCSIIRLSNSISGSSLSDSSFLNSSNGSLSAFNEDTFEKIEINRGSTPTSAELGKYIDSLKLFLKLKSNAILINTQGGSKFIEIKKNYKDICFNDLFDIVSSVEEWTN